MKEILGGTQETQHKMIKELVKIIAEEAKMQESQLNFQEESDLLKLFILKFFTRQPTIAPLYIQTYHETIG